MGLIIWFDTSTSLSVLFCLGTIRNISPQLWKLNHLTVLYMTDNQLTRVPADICQLTHLIKLDLSYNKLRSLPVEIGDLISLRYVVSHMVILIQNSLFIGFVLMMMKMMEMRMGMKIRTKTGMMWAYLSHRTRPVIFITSLGAYQSRFWTWSLSGTCMLLSYGYKLKYLINWFYLVIMIIMQVNSVCQTKWVVTSLRSLPVEIGDPISLGFLITIVVMRTIFDEKDTWPKVMCWLQYFQFVW